MTKKETVDFMQRIKSYYQEFVIDEFKIGEWYKSLKKYDSIDVNEKLDNHLQSEVYGEQVPKLHFLIRYLIPTEDKGRIVHHTVRCQLCGQAIIDSQYDTHYSRCCSAEAIVRDIKKYYSKSLDYQELMEYSNEKFERTYQAYLNKILEAPIPNFRRKLIMKCIYPQMEFDVINDLIKDVVIK